MMIIRDENVFYNSIQRYKIFMIKLLLSLSFLIYISLRNYLFRTFDPFLFNTEIKRTLTIY